MPIPEHLIDIFDTLVSGVNEEITNTCEYLDCRISNKDQVDKLTSKYIEHLLKYISVEPFQSYDKE